MFRYISVVILIACCLTGPRCSCDDSSTGPDDQDDNPIAQIDAAIQGVWHRYDSTGQVLDTVNFCHITDSSIELTGHATYTGVVDTVPFGNTLVAKNGQVYRDYVGTVTHQYLFDYTLTSGDSVLFLVAEGTDSATNPSQSTINVMFLKRHIDTIADLDIIDPALLGTWDRYDSSFTTRIYSSFLVVTGSYIRYLNAITFTGLSDPGGTTGRTLVAQDGQIYYDYHDPGTPDIYRFDYTFVSGSNNTRMYFINEETSVYTAPSPAADTVVVVFLRKR